MWNQLYSRTSAGPGQVWALLALMCFGCAHREAPATRSFLAAAPQGISLDDLGRPYDTDFQRLQGPQGGSLFPKAGPPVSTLQAGMDHQFVAADNEETLRANASAWTISAAAGTASKRRYASYRAFQVDRVHAVDDTTKMRRAPTNAVYYPWRIYVGRRYEVLFEGDEDTFDASVRAEFGVFGGGIEDFTRNNRVEARTVAIGLKPRHATAIFAKDPAAIEEAYEQHTGSVPILVEWRVIPGRVAKDRPIAWRSRRALKKGCNGEPGCEPCTAWEFVSVEYTAPGRKRGGGAWDGDGSMPDLVLQLRVQATDSARTSRKFQDARRATWRLDPPLTVDMGGGSAKLQLRVTDSDLMADDHMEHLDVEVPREIPNGRLEMGGGSGVLTARCRSGESGSESTGTRFIPRPVQ